MTDLLISLTWDGCRATVISNPHCGESYTEPHPVHFLVNHNPSASVLPGDRLQFLILSKYANKLCDLPLSLNVQFLEFMRL